MRPIQIVTTSFPTADIDYLAASQTLTGAGFLTLVASSIVPARFVTITSAGDDSGVLFTITGVGPNNETQTETVSGANAGAVTSTKTFAFVESIFADGATDGAVEAGVAQSGYSQWIPLDIYTPNQVTTLSATVSGTIDYSIEYTNEDPFDHSFTHQVVPHPAAGGAFTAATTSQTHFTTTLMRAVRYKVNSGDGSIRLTITQQSTA
jgi:hypothetical protein